MKKVIKLLTIILFVSLSINVIFASSGVVLKSSSTNVMRGNSFTVTVSISGASKVKSIGLEPKYDKSQLELVSNKQLVGNTMLAKFTGSEVAIAFDKETSPNTNIWSFTFKAKEGANLGKTTISVVPTLKNGTENVSASTGNITINITCKHNYSSWKVTKQPTCTSTGAKERTCSICNHVDKEIISANGHNYSEFEIITEPTCTTEGLKQRICSICGYVEKQTIPMIEHKIENPTITKQPTCTSKGQQKGVCSLCGKEVTVDIEMIEHTYTIWNEILPSTCENGGIRESVCDVCGQRITENSLPLGHDYVISRTIKQASLTSMGENEEICSRCGVGRVSFSDCQYCDEATGICVKTSQGVFQDGTCLIINSNQQDERNIFYDLSTDNDTKVNGNLELTIPLPDSFNQNCSFNYVDGQALPIIIDENNRTITANINHLGTYYLKNLNQEDDGGIYKKLTYGLGFASVVLLLMLINKKQPIEETKPTVVKQKPIVEEEKPVVKKENKKTTKTDTNKKGKKKNQKKKKK